MAHDAIPTTEPQSFKRGDTVIWTRNFSGHKPEDTWLLTYHLVHPVQKETIVTTDNTDSTHLATLTATASKTWAPGDWAWQAVVTKAAIVHTLDEGTFEVEVGFGELSAGEDTRTFWARVLESLEATILQGAASNELTVSVDGYSASFESQAEFMAYHAKVLAKVAGEKTLENRRRGLGTGNAISVRF